MKLKALILAAGEGSRLSPITELMPKSLIPVNGRPVLYWILKHLGGRFDNVIRVAYKFYPQFDNFLEGNHFQGRSRAILSLGDVPLGTVGEVLACRELLEGDDFLLYYGDTLTNLDLDLLVKFHSSSGGVATIALVSPTLGYGLASIDELYRVSNFEEKPRLQIQSRGFWCGVALCSSEIFPYLKGYDFGMQIWPSLAREGKLYGLPFPEAYYYDLGDIGRLREAEEALKRGELG